MKRNIIYLMLALVVATACEQDDPNVKSTNAKEFAGEWFVTYTVDGVDIGGGHSALITSNTAANTANEILISDYVDPNAKAGNFWSYKVKANANSAENTFSATEVESTALYDLEPYPIKVNILNGKIIPGGGHSRTGVVVDSIYFEIQFEDDAPAFGNTYVVSGHKRTGFTADEF